MIQNTHIKTAGVGAFQVNEYAEFSEWAWWSYYRLPGFVETHDLYVVQVAEGATESETLPKNWTVLFW